MPNRPAAYHPGKTSGNFPVAPRTTVGDNTPHLLLPANRRRWAFAVSIPTAAGLATISIGKSNDLASGAGYSLKATILISLFLGHNDIGGAIHEEIWWIDGGVATTLQAQEYVLDDYTCPLCFS